MLDALSLIIGVLVGSSIDFVLTLWIEWKGTQWNKKEFVKLENKIDAIAKKMK